MTTRIEALSAVSDFGFDDATDSNDCAVSEVLDTPRITVFAETPLTANEARTLESRVTRAAAYGDSLQHWDDDAKWKEKLNVTLLSDRCMSGLTGAPADEVPGMTTGPDDIFLRRASLRASSARDSEVLAHELVHVEDWRMAGRSEPEIPLYLKEGKAYVVGLRYGNEPARNEQVRRDLSYLSASDARWVMKQFRESHPSGNSNASYFGEITGALFVEWLEAHVKKGALTKLGNAVEASGNGRDFATAFKKEFGVSLAKTETDFVSFIAKTERNPSARFSGTIFR